MDAVHVVVVLAALLCGMVTGLLLAFAVVAMPGIGTLEDGRFLSAFRAMDRVIQDRDPLFMTLWVGSVIAVGATGVLGVIDLDGTDRTLAVAAAAVYLVGVQLPTATINIPLNNGVQALDVETMDAAALRDARAAFETRWNRWNRIRTMMGGLATVLLLVLLLQLSV